MADRQLSEAERRVVLDRFEAVGVSVVQDLLLSQRPSMILDVPGNAGVREIAQEWIKSRLSTERRRKLRNDWLLWIGTVAAVLAAIFSVLAFI